MPILQFTAAVNKYGQQPPVENYIKPSFHPEIGLVSSLELARIELLEKEASA